MLDSLMVVSTMVATLVTGAEPAAALRPLAIMPDRFEARAGERIELRLQQASAGSAESWKEHPTSWFSVRVAGSQENLEQHPAAGAAAAAGTPVTIDLTQPGVTMIGAEFAPVVVRMAMADVRDGLGGVITGAELEAALKGLEGSKTVRVKVVRGAKAFVRALPKYDADPAPADAQTAGSKFGHGTEVRLLMNVLDMAVGGTASVRLHADFERSAGSRVEARCIESGRVQEVVSDKSGIAKFSLDERGRWGVSFTTARRAPEGADADVIVYAASVTFAALREEAGK